MDVIQTRKQRRKSEEMDLTRGDQALWYTTTRYTYHRHHRTERRGCSFSSSGSNSAFLSSKFNSKSIFA